ncbi:MAG: hypothetical protein V3W04_07780 [Gammaproteobacteria bacterium]
MKKWILALVSALLFLSPVLEAKSRRYEVKSGMVSYELSGGGSMLGIKTSRNGHKTLYFEDYGNVEVQETEETTTTMGRTERHHELVKIMNGMVYSVDFEDKVIIKQDMTNMMEDKDVGKMGKDMLEQMGGKKVGSGKVLGHTCEIWEVMGSRIWIHKGVTLKTEANIMGMKHAEIATEAKFGKSIPSDKLKLPDFPVRTLDEVMQQKMNAPDR